jgi:hypothetical protein
LEIAIATGLVDVVTVVVFRTVRGRLIKREQLRTKMKIDALRRGTDPDEKSPFSNIKREVVRPKPPSFTQKQD